MYSEKQAISYTEKRYLRKQPEYPQTLQELKQYSKDFEAFFNDHFGFRESLIKLYSYTLAKLLYTSPKWYVTRGKGDWLFLADLTVLGNFVGNNTHPKKHYYQWKQVLQDRTNWLRQFSTEYLFTIAPDKMMVYPEYLPPHIRRLEGKNNVDDLFERINTPPRAPCALDIRQPLQAAKSMGLVYYKADTHWNSFGAFVAYQAILEELGQRIPDLTPLSLNEMQVSSKTVDIEGVADIINLSASYHDIETRYSLPPDLQSSWKQEMFRQQEPIVDQNFRQGKLMVSEQPLQTRTAILISDSFGEAIRDFIASHFRKTLHVTDARFEDITELIKEVRPDVIIDLNVARAYHIALGEHKGMTKESIRRQVAVARPRLEMSSKNATSHITGEDELRWEIQGEQLQLTATGKDAKLFLTTPMADNLPSQSGPVVNIQCDISSSVNSVFALYYLPTDEENFSQRRVLTADIAPGRNSLFFRIYEPIRLDRLRLDPGADEGSYTLHRLVIADSPDV